MGKRLLSLALVLPALTACGSGGGTSGTSTATTPPASTRTAPQQMSITVFHVRKGILRPEVVDIPSTRGVAGAALRALGLPPTVTISAGTAHLDAPELTEEQRAEVVYTLTQFPSIEAVSLNGGEPRTRAEYQAFAPPILVEQPAAGATVGAVFTVSGTASVFEATLVVQVVRAGVVLEKQTVTASAGAPDRGTFTTTVHASPGPLTIQAFSPSAVDGSPQHEVDVAVVVRQ